MKTNIQGMYVVEIKTDFKSYEDEQTTIYLIQQALEEGGFEVNNVKCIELHKTTDVSKELKSCNDNM